VPPGNTFIRRLLATSLALTFAPCAQQTRAQQRPAGAQQTPAPQESSKKTPAPDDDVLQVSTELVQTAVTVIDAKGQFVGGLRREQFEMLLDGKPQPISFFEQVEAGTVAEQRHLAAAGGGAASVAPAGAATATTERGRTVFLFVDDVHLTSTSYMQVRKTLTHYVDAVMGQNDEALIATTSGSLGFLQQLTDNKAVLRAAIARLNFRPSISNLTGNPPITTYQAIAVEERNDNEIFEYLVQETLRSTPGLPRKMAESLVHSRTRVIARESAFTSKATLSTLEGLLRSSARLPGRKIVFFLSDGFLLQMQNSDEAEQLRRITDAAARSDAVVYAVDSHGLATDPYFEAANGMGDVSGRGLSVSHSTADLRAQQEPLKIIAEETGGRALVNTNDLDAGVARALDESSRYYLLAWRPESEANRGGKFRRLEVRVAGRPDLSVRLHKGYLVHDAKPAAKGDKPAAATTPESELRAALSATFPVRQLPVDLSVNFVDTPDRGAILTASAGVPSYPLTFASAGEKRTATVEMACVVYNDQGKPAASSQRRLEIGAADAAGASLPQRDIAYNFQFDKLPPGLYQVRAAARDGESGRAGSASQWIEIPDLKKRKLALSSLLIGGAQDAAGGQSEPEPLELYVSHKFPRASRLRFYTYVYNASRGAGGQGAPDLIVRVQVWNGDRVIIDAGERRVATDGATDLARMAYGGEFNLASLPAGRYLLQVTATDRLSKQTAAQTTRFEIK
jgi:VWFA-related protein